MPTLFIGAPARRYTEDKANEDWYVALSEKNEHFRIDRLNFQIHGPEDWSAWTMGSFKTEGDLRPRPKSNFFPILYEKNSIYDRELLKKYCQ